MEDIPVSGSHIARQSHVDTYSHLKGVSVVELPINEVSILIGTDLAYSFAPKEVRKAGEDVPDSFLCPFGWVLMGKAGGQTDQLAWTAFASFQDRQFEDCGEEKCLDSHMKTAAFQEDTFLVKILPEKVGGGPEVV